MKETKFKQTEVGMIPSDWEVKTLEEVCQNQGIVRGPFGGALKKEMFVSSGYKVYEQKNAIYKSVDLGQYFVDASKYREMARFSIKPGDFIVSCSGTIGKIFKIPKKAPEGIINQALLKLSADEGKISSDYFITYFECDHFQRAIIDDTQGGAMKNLVGMDKFRKSLFILPPTIKEQQRIANALSDVDTLINNLEKLIAKKKNIKQGAMQQLLTGRKRLPGFAPDKPTYKQTELGKIPSDWECVSILDILTSSKDGIKIGPFGSQLKKEYLMSSGTYKVFGQENIYSHNFVDCYRFLSKERFNQLKSCELKEGDFIISTMGTIGKCDVVPTNAGVGIMDSHLVRLRLGNCCDANFFKHFFQSYLVQNQISALSVGGIMNGLSTSIIKRLLVLKINKNEQTAIANVLSDMDTEIATLETKLAKYRKLKTGMMQQLLTGKIRLIK